MECTPAFTTGQKNAQTFPTTAIINSPRRVEERSQAFTPGVIPTPTCSDFFVTPFASATGKG
jgi:hypothetical protein